MWVGALLDLWMNLDDIHKSYATQAHKDFRQGSETLLNVFLKTVLSITTALTIHPDLSFNSSRSSFFLTLIW